MVNDAPHISKGRKGACLVHSVFFLLGHNYYATLSIWMFSLNKRDHHEKSFQHNLYLIHKIEIK